jgi:DNA polymerase (family 10)/putative hydrolase
MTGKWKKYKNFLMTGQWHIHTSFTDGDSPISEYAEKANSLGIPLIAFTEHVRKDLTYDFKEFLEQIDVVRKTFPEMIILSGCEAKVLPDGSADCPEWILEKADYKLFAFHSFPADVENYFNALCKIIQSGQFDGWAHPGLFFKENPKLSLPEEQLKEIFRLVETNQILLEKNSKYNLPPQRWLEIIKSMNSKILFVYGGDIHKIQMLSKPDISLLKVERK